MAESPGPGADLRFSLASERTLLAYQRTAVALIVAAVGFAHFLDRGPLLLALCLVLTLGGAVAAVGGHTRYLAANRAISTGEPMESSPIPLVLTGVLGVGVVLSAIMVATKAG